MPGTDIDETLRTVLGELPDLPHLPELPGRGAGADLVGRGAALLTELPVELYASRWRVASRPGRELRLARDFLERDLDALTDQAAGYPGMFKIQAAGPWTLAASIDLQVGGRLLRDAGATADLTASLAEGLRAHVGQVLARLPMATVVVQLDEPWLPAVLAGQVPTESGLYTYRSVTVELARSALRAVIEAVRVPVLVHCCAPSPPLRLLRDAGAVGVAVDLNLVTDLDPLGELLDAGLALLAGVVDPRSPIASGPADQAPGTAPASASAAPADRIREVWRKLGFPAAQAARQVVVTPTCGLAGVPADRVVALLAVCRDAGRRLRDDGA